MTEFALFLSLAHGLPAFYSLTSLHPFECVVLSHWPRHTPQDRQVLHSPLVVALRRDSPETALQSPGSIVHGHHRPLTARGLPHHGHHCHGQHAHSHDESFFPDRRGKQECWWKGPRNTCGCRPGGALTKPAELDVTVCVIILAMVIYLADCVNSMHPYPCVLGLWHVHLLWAESLPQCRRINYYR